MTSRHVEHISSLTAQEWSELHSAVDDATERLAGTFAPDHFNYAFLQNVDSHVHLHVIPRYASARPFLGRMFEDPTFGDH
ncbi:MAG: HIT domain-containing protein [Nocardioidaceae bacterium]